jgi:hypothetical protein
MQSCAQWPIEFARENQAALNQMHDGAVRAIASLCPLPKDRALPRSVRSTRANTVFAELDLPTVDYNDLAVLERQEEGILSQNRARQPRTPHAAGGHQMDAEETARSRDSNPHQRYLSG